MIPKIAIGSETEYGIFLTNEGQPLYLHRHITRAIQAMLDEAQAVVPASFKGVDERFLSREEHNRAEEEIIRETIERNVRSNTGISDAMAQRRGYTGRMLSNGARFYQDMGHPEYSCPEVACPYEAVVVQKAGDYIVACCRELAEESAYIIHPTHGKVKIRIDKNNSDGKGNSYAAHENYSLSSKLFRAACEYRTPEFNATLLFFVMRQIIIGSGKVGSETRRPIAYQISQRADFMQRMVGIDTTHNRGIINVRNVAYAGYNTLRRFHVIVGDSNMSELSLFLKFGTAALFFMMLEDGFLFRSNTVFGIPLYSPVKTHRAVSRDVTLQKQHLLKNGQYISALSVLWEFAESADSFIAQYGLSPEYRSVITLLKKTLLGLGGNRNKDEHSRSLDWVLKERLIASYIRRKGVDPLDDACRSIDLQYHNIDERESIFSLLQEKGRVLRIVRDEDIRHMVQNAPDNTRAWFRSEFIRRYHDAVLYVRWDEIHIMVDNDGYQREMLIKLPSPLCGGKEELGALFSEDLSLNVFLEKLKRCDKNIVRLTTTGYSSR